MTYYDVEARAIKYVLEGRIKQIGENEYEVTGDHGKYNVMDKGAKASCECRNYVIDGVTKGFICSHIRAVILFKFLRRMELKEGLKAKL